MKYFKFCLPTLGQSWLILLLTIAGQLLASIVTMPFSMAHPDATWLILTIPYILTFILPVLYIWISGRNRYRENEVTGLISPVEIEKPSFGNLHPALFFFAIIVSAYAVVLAEDPFNIWMPAPEWFEQLMEKVTAQGDFFWTFFTVVICAPILEEFVCRGIICRGLLSHYRSPRPAILWSAVIFAVMHLNPWQGIPAFLLGIWYGWIYYRTRSLKTTMFLHFVNNGSVVILSQLVPAFAEREYMYEFFPSMDLYWLAVALALALFIVANCLLLNRFLPHKQVNNFE